MNPEIDQYLQKKEKDFNEGFALFCRYSRNESLMSWIGRKKDEARLVYELGKLSRMGASGINPLADRHILLYNKAAGPAAESSGSSAGAAASAGIVFKTYDERKTRRADLPERLQKVYDDIAGDYKLRRSYHEKMKTAMTDKDRAELRAKVLETQERIDSGWEEIDKWLLEKESGKVEESFKESTCRSYISKMLRKKDLKPDQIEKIRIRAEAMQKHGCTLSDEIIDKLKTLGIIYQV